MAINPLNMFTRMLLMERRGVERSEALRYSLVLSVNDSVQPISGTDLVVTDVIAQRQADVAPPPAQGQPAPPIDGGQPAPPPDGENQLAMAMVNALEELTRQLEANRDLQREMYEDLKNSIGDSQTQNRVAASFEINVDDTNLPDITVYFRDTSTGIVDSNEWIFDDGETENKQYGQEVSIEYGKPAGGMINVQLKVISKDGFEDIATGVVKIITVTEEVV